MREVTYAGNQWEVIYEGERVLHLRSLRDKQLIIHCSINSEFLSNEYREETEHSDSGSFGNRKVDKSEESGPSNDNNPEHRTETTSVQSSSEVQASGNDIRT